MEQVRVSISFLERVTEKLMAGRWPEVAQEHGFKRE
jgi:hypothetical protein